MGANCPYCRSGKCANPTDPRSLDCSWPESDYQSCSVYVLITDPARGRRQVLESFVAPSEPSRHGAAPPSSPSQIVQPKPSSFFARLLAKLRHSRSKQVVITNSIGMKLVLIPAGEFLMGSPDSDKTAARWERPQHRVRITKPYYMGIYPVTQAEYERVIGTNPSQIKGDSRPVEYISWDDAQEYCRRLSALPTEKAAGHAYRLPTEAQWEYACRAGSTTRWCRGDDEVGLRDYAWCYENSDYSGYSGGQTHWVGQKKANAWGLFDMHGNVWEWCEDWFDPGYYANSMVNDPKGPSGGSLRVCRGGSWHTAAVGCRSADRNFIEPGYSNFYLGFRVSRVPAE